MQCSQDEERSAEAIAEAATSRTMRLVVLKSEAQLDVQTLHRVRYQVVGERTALTNQIRSILLKRGHVIPRGGLNSLPASPRCSTRMQAHRSRRECAPS